jgi:hypothetical protein
MSPDGRFRVSLAQESGQIADCWLVYRFWIGLAALLGLGVGAIVSFIIGITGATSPECDGACLQQWDEIALVSFVIGVGTAVAFGLIARRLLRRDLVMPS